MHTSAPVAPHRVHLAARWVVEQSPELELGEVAALLHDAPEVLGAVEHAARVVAQLERRTVRPRFRRRRPL